MIRFIMPEAALPLEEKKTLLQEQFDTFLQADALEDILSVIDIDRGHLAEKYDGRHMASGSIIESQDMAEMSELENIRERLFPLFKELGSFDIGDTCRGDHNRLVIYGGALGACFDRTNYSVRFLTERTVSIDALTCYRPINPVERDRTESVSDADTEAGAMTEALEKVYGLSGGTWEDSFSGDRNLNAIACRRIYRGGTCGTASREDAGAPVYRVFSAPSLEPELRRADTGDCIDYYIQQASVEDGDSILAVTNRRFCNRQFIQTAYQLIKNDQRIDFDIVGCHRRGIAPTADTYDPLQYLQDLIGTLDWIKRFRQL